jgi:hypothetical protein
VGGLRAESTVRRGITLAEMFATTQDLPPGYDRLAVAVWAEPYGTDVARAVREWGAIGWSVWRKLRREADERYQALRAPLRQLRRGRRA